MRKLASLLVILLCSAVGAGEAQADGPANLQCNPAEKKTHNCFVGDIFVVDGGPYEDALSFGPCESHEQCRDPNIPANARRVCVSNKCVSEIATCAKTNFEKAYNCEAWKVDSEFVIFRLHETLKAAGHKNPAWDQIVIWMGDQEDNQTPRWYRAPALKDNGTKGLGLPVSSRPSPPEYQFEGWIAAGPTNRVEDPLQDAYPCPAGIACNFTFGLVNQFDALAIATGNMSAPYVRYARSDPEAQTPSDLVAAQGGFDLPRWSGLLDMKGSLLGGNNWRNNGNDTVESTLPPPLTGVIPPFLGQLGLSFLPLDLYLMGFLSKDQVPAVRLFDKESAMIVRPTATPRNYGTEMRFVTYVVRPGKRWSITLDEIIAESGARDPGFDQAPHHIRQLWIVVTPPGVVLPDFYEEKVGDKTVKVDGGIVKLQKWREMWNWYFYMLTHWRGRMISTYEGNVDDSPYWEFGQPTDDRGAFSADGGLMVKEFVSKGVLADSGHVVVDSLGANSTMRFTKGGSFPIRVNPKSFDAATIRMRIPTAAFPPGTAHASISFPGGPTKTIPGSDKAFLIPDGKWHTYSVNLSEDPTWFNKTSYDSLTVSPTSVAAANIEIDSVRLVRAENPKDSDIECGVNKAAKPDGWVDDFDNCSEIYNPGQEDGNGDGVGDACEDVDGDTVPNLCDNCPTKSNSRQRDRDNDGIGDNCDDEPGDSCCLNPSAVGGAGLPPPSLFSGVLLGIALTVLVVRRRRRQ